MLVRSVQLELQRSQVDEQRPLNLIGFVPVVVEIVALEFDGPAERKQLARHRRSARTQRVFGHSLEPERLQEHRLPVSDEVVLRGDKESDSTCQQRPASGQDEVAIAPGGRPEELLSRLGQVIGLHVERKLVLGPARPGRRAHQP